MKKKSIYLLVIMSVVMLLLILGGTKVNASASNEDATISGNYGYCFVTKEDTEYGNVFGTIEEIESLGASVDYAIITKYIGNETNVIIPSKIFGYPIKGIGIGPGPDGTFAGCSTIKSVTIPSTIEYIEEYCFANCKNLSSINIPSNIETLSDNLFENCVSLKNITIPKTVTYIGDDVFKGCKNLTIKCDPTSRALQYAFDKDIKYTLTSKVNIKSNSDVWKYIDTESKSYSGKTKKTNIYISYDFGLFDQYDQYTYAWYDLKEGTDYTVTYKNNKNIGTATVTITGKGNYTGTITKTFKIVPKKVTLSSVKNVSKKSAKITWKKDSMATGYEVYMAKKVVDNDYMKTTAKLTLRKSASTSSKALKNIPKGTELYIIKKNVKKSGGYTWYKVGYYGQDDYYEGYVASKYLTKCYKEGKYTKVKTVTKNSTTSYTKKKLSKGTTYYFKVRSYKTVSGKKYYGFYSKVKSVKIKK